MKPQPLIRHLYFTLLQTAGSVLVASVTLTLIATNLAVADLDKSADPNLNKGYSADSGINLPGFQTNSQSELFKICDKIPDKKLRKLCRKKKTLKK